MAFNIETFKTLGLIHGGARPSLFKIVIPVWLGGDTGISTQLSLVAKASSIPPSSVDSIDVGYFGRKVKVVGDRTYPNWSVTIMNDEDFSVRQALENWHNNLNTAVSNIQSAGKALTSTPANYKRDIDVIQYSKKGMDPRSEDRGVRLYRLYGAFPVAIDAINLDWDATNQIEQFNVEFAYDYWIADPTENNADSITEYVPNTLSNSNAVDDQR